MRPSLLLTLLFLCANSLPASDPPHEFTEADVSSFLDGLIPHILEKEDIAGAVVLIVKDGKTLFAKGYGYADMASKKPVIVDATLFRPGSISKLFTWTAVMQLVEQGKLDLDRDVNSYIDFQIPATYGKAITMRHLMTHTAGFEETYHGLFVQHATEVHALSQYLTTHLPPRILAPGSTPAYSNYGTALAGYIVERISGKSFSDYVQTNMFAPLSMSRSSFAQPLPSVLQPFMSAGYGVASKTAKTFEFVQPAPAGALAATAADISRFMLAHLAEGTLDGSRILSRETTRLMHARQDMSPPGVNASALGFYEESSHGHRIIGHGGDTSWFHSDLHLMLDTGVGFFISQNSAGKGDDSLRRTVWSKLLDRYYPQQQPAAAQPSPQEANQIAGSYEPSRGFASKVVKFLNLLGQEKITANADGSLEMANANHPNGTPKKFLRIQPYLYEDPVSRDRIAALKDSDGVTRFSVDSPDITFLRVPWYQNQLFNAILFGFCGAVFLLTVVLWPVAAAVRHHYGLFLQYRKTRLRLLTRIACILNLVFMGGFVALFATTDDAAALNDSFDLLTHLLQVVGLAGVIGTIPAVYNAMYAVNSTRWWWTKLHESAIAIAAIVYTALVLQWHLLNFNLRF